MEGACLLEDPNLICPSNIEGLISCQWSWLINKQLDQTANASLFTLCLVWVSTCVLIWWFPLGLLLLIGKQLKHFLFSWKVWVKVQSKNVWVMWFWVILSLNICVPGTMRALGPALREACWCAGGGSIGRPLTEFCSRWRLWDARGCEWVSRPPSRLQWTCGHTGATSAMRSWVTQVDTES